MARDRDDEDDLEPRRGKRDDDYDDEPRDRGPRRDIPNHLTNAILVTICCCLPFGIVAIVNAAKVNSLVAAGSYREAQEASDSAKKWITWGMISGLVIGALNVVAQVALKK